MIAVKAHYNGHVFVPESPVSAEINQEAIITLLDKKDSGASKKEQLLRLAGSISHDEYLELEKTLEDTERVYPNEW
jgi:hypothetical protein